MQLVLASHGPLAKALSQSAELVTGVDPACCHVVTMAPDTSREDVAARLDEIFSSFGDEPDVLALTDVFGGSITSALLEYAASHPMHIVTGMNFPMVLEAVLSLSSRCTDEFVEMLVETGRAGVIDVCRQASDRGEEGEI